MKTIRLTSLLCAMSIAGMAAPSQAQTVLTTHRLSEALASEAAAAAVASCAKQGYKVTASIIDADGVVQAMLRGDGASMTTLGAARDKAYTAIMLGAPRNEDRAPRSPSAWAPMPRPAVSPAAAHSAVAGRGGDQGRRRGGRRHRGRRRAGRQSRRSVRQGRARQDRRPAQVSGSNALRTRLAVREEVDLQARKREANRHARAFTPASPQTD